MWVCVCVHKLIYIAVVSAKIVDLLYFICCLASADSSPVAIIAMLDETLREKSHRSVMLLITGNKQWQTARVNILHVTRVTPLSSHIAYELIESSHILYVINVQYVSPRHMI